MVAVDSWEADSLYPSGHYVRTLGAIGDKETETEVGVRETAGRGAAGGRRGVFGMESRRLCFELGILPALGATCCRALPHRNG